MKIGFPECVGDYDQFFQAEWPHMTKALMRLQARGPVFQRVKGLGIRHLVELVLGDEARRTGLRGHRQKRQMEGRHISIGGKLTYLRATDRSERVYVCVRALQLAGESNFEACRFVAGRLDSNFGISNRGRRRTSTRARDFLDKVDTVQSVFNAFKRRHPFKAELPTRDFLLDKWCWYFMNALVTGAMNIGFDIHLQRPQDHPPERARSLRPSAILLACFKLAESGHTIEAGQIVERLIGWSS